MVGGQPLKGDRFFKSDGDLSSVTRDDVCSTISIMDATCLASPIYPAIKNDVSGCWTFEHTVLNGLRLVHELDIIKASVDAPFVPLR